MRKPIRQQSSDRQRVWSGLAFWAVTLTGIALFALGVLSTPWCERQAARERLAVEQANVRRVEQLAENLTVICDALAEDPEYLARQIRQDLGYRRPNEVPLPSDGNHLCPPLATCMPEPLPAPALARVCRIFSRPVVKQVTIAAGVMLLGIALLWFETPARRGRADAPAPPHTDSSH